MPTDSQLAEWLVDSQDGFEYHRYLRMSARLEITISALRAARAENEGLKARVKELETKIAGYYYQSAKTSSSHGV